MAFKSTKNHQLGIFPPLKGFWGFPGRWLPMTGSNIYAYLMANLFKYACFLHQKNRNTSKRKRMPRILFQNFSQKSDWTKIFAPRMCHLFLLCKKIKFVTYTKHNVQPQKNISRSQTVIFPAFRWSFAPLHEVRTRTTTRQPCCKGKLWAFLKMVWTNTWQFFVLFLGQLSDLYKG